MEHQENTGWGYFRQDGTSFREVISAMAGRLTLRSPIVLNRLYVEELCSVLLLVALEIIYWINLTQK